MTIKSYGVGVLVTSSAKDYPDGLVQDLRALEPVWRKALNPI